MSFIKISNNSIKQFHFINFIFHVCNKQLIHYFIIDLLYSDSFEKISFKNIKYSV